MTVLLPLRRTIDQLRRFRDHEGGSLALMAGLSAIPIIFAVGAGVDYSTANMTKAKLDAIADSAALSAVDHQSISSTATVAQTTAQNTFNAQASTLNNIAIGSMT